MSMPGPASAKKAKRARADTSTDDPEAIETPSTSSTSASRKLCIICGGTAARNIMKDGNYDAMLQLYWCTLGVDVKPDACKKCDLCKQCFQKMVEYFETNDIIVYFENYFKSMRMNLLRKTLKGIAEWTKEGQPLTKIHQEVKKKYGDDLPNEPEEEQINNTLSGYEMESYNIVDSDEEEGGSKGAVRSGIKLTKKKVSNTDGATEIA